MPRKTEKRIEGVDSLRGVACILVVAFHVVGLEQTGLEVQNGFWRESTAALAFVRLPLFTVLSGVVYAARPIRGGIRSFLIGKSRRLLVPMLVLGTSFALLRQFVSDGTYEWQFLHLKPVGYFWYLESLWFVFIIVAVLELLGLLRTKLRFLGTWLAVSALFLVTFESLVSIDWLSVSGTTYLLPFFLFGLAIARFELVNYVRMTPSAMAGVLVVLTGLFASYSWGNNLLRIDLIGNGFGLIVCFGLLQLRLQSTILARVGVHSYSIYLLHGFCVSISNTLMEPVVGQMVLPHVIAGLALSVTVGILAEMVVSKSRFLGFAVLGRSLKPKPKPTVLPSRS